jgi:glutathione S-transferase
VLGETFTAADVTLGAALTVGLFTQQIEPDPALSAYNDRLAARPAYQAARDANWPPEMFQQGEPAAT